jgi:hypothetical protein
MRCTAEGDPGRRVVHRCPAWGTTLLGGVQLLFICHSVYSVDGVNKQFKRNPEKLARNLRTR